MKLTKPEIEKQIQSFCDAYSNRKKMRQANISLYVLRTFYRSNRIDGLRLQGYKFNATIRASRVPTRQEAHKMAEEVAPVKKSAKKADDEE